MSQIRVHPEHGINAFTTVCPACGADGRELILVGADDGVYECGDCKATQFGRGRGKCAGCGGSNLGNRVRTLKQGEKLPVSFCEPCVKNRAEMMEAVKAGGIFWECTDCKKGGAINANEYTKQFRDAVKVQPPDPCGIRYNKSNCPLCTKQVTEPIPDAPTEAPAP